MNKWLVGFSGYTEDELMGNNLASLCVDGEAYADVSEELAQKRAVRNRGLALKTKLGEEKTVLFSGSVVRSKTGRDIGISCVIRDITDRKQIEERLVRAERLASISELAGQVGHDLRNPLTGIKSGLYFLHKKGSGITDAERKRILDLIDDAVEDSNRIVSSLVDYSLQSAASGGALQPQVARSERGVMGWGPAWTSVRDQTAEGVELMIEAPQWSACSRASCRTRWKPYPRRAR